MLPWPSLVRSRTCQSNVSSQETHAFPELVRFWQPRYAPKVPCKDSSHSLFGGLGPKRVPSPPRALTNTAKATQKRVGKTAAQPGTARGETIPFSLSNHLEPSKLLKKMSLQNRPKTPCWIYQKCRSLWGGSLSEVFTMPLCGNDSYILDTQTIILVQVCARYIHVNFGCD